MSDRVTLVSTGTRLITRTLKAYYSRATLIGARSEEDGVTLPPIATAWNSLGETIRAHPDKARAKYAPATATLQSGLKCRVTGPFGESIETDMPPA